MCAPVNHEVRHRGTGSRAGRPEARGREERAGDHGLRTAGPQAGKREHPTVGGRAANARLAADRIEHSTPNAQVGIAETQRRRGAETQGAEGWQDHWGQNDEGRSRARGERRTSNIQRSTSNAQGQGRGNAKAQRRKEGRDGKTIEGKMGGRQNHWRQNHGRSKGPVRRGVGPRTTNHWTTSKGEARNEAEQPGMSLLPVLRDGILAPCRIQKVHVVR